MRFNRVYLDAICYELPSEIVTTAQLEAQLSGLYRRLHLTGGQVAALTGLKERRFWPRGVSLSHEAAKVGAAALAQADITPQQLGAVVYAGVCREYLEPATACAVAAQLGVGPETLVYDVANACLGVMSAVIDLASRVELGQIRAGLVVAAESARDINEKTLRDLDERGDLLDFHRSLATLTGGSGAAAILVTDGSFAAGAGHKLLGGAARTAPEHHDLCRWGWRDDGRGGLEAFAATDAVNVLKHGVTLGAQTWQAMLTELAWQPKDIDRCVTHQIGVAHRQKMLSGLGLAPEQDFPTFSYLGNMGTVSLPTTAALAAERGHLRRGDRVGMLGIGSGLNCLMLGVEW